MPTTRLPLHGALQTLVVTAGAAPEAQRSPQTTPPRELLTPGWGMEDVRHGHSRWLGGGGPESLPADVGPPRPKKGELGYLHTLTAPTPSHSLLGKEKRERSVSGDQPPGPTAQVRGMPLPPPGGSLWGSRGGPATTARGL